MVFLLISDFVTEVWMVQFNLLTMSMSMKIHVKLFNYMVNGNLVFPCCSFPLPSCFPCPNFLCLPYPTLLTSGQLFRFFCHFFPSLPQYLRSSFFFTHPLLPVTLLWFFVRFIFCLNFLNLPLAPSASWVPIENLNYDLSDICLVFVIRIFTLN